MKKIPEKEKGEKETGKEGGGVGSQKKFHLFPFFPNKDYRFEPLSLWA